MSHFIIMLIKPNWCNNPNTCIDSLNDIIDGPVQKIVVESPDSIWVRILISLLIWYGQRLFLSLF